MIAEVKKLIMNSKKLVVLTGAGFSAESGIPTYRGTGGLWSKYDPSVYADINHFMRDSSYYWNFFRDERYPMIKKAKPNSAHIALVELYKRGKLFRLITQNIDGLHQLAGIPHVIELHGTTRSFRCMRCDNRFSMEEVHEKILDDFPPKCSCNGSLRPNTVMFGESLPQHALEESMLAAKKCDVFLVLGSSLVVYPAAYLPCIAKENNAHVVIVNIDPTPFDKQADAVLYKKASMFLEQLLL
ncbi:MAG: NAD-dependent deacylase [Candidatus Thermoplasmatota archaeon]|nr:NAD-dependent deacylase [Candidatus Thermoplasmatota archaeon]